MMKKITVLMIFLFILIKGFSQSNCPDSAIFHTSDLGNGIEQIKIPLKFKIYRDSILIRDDAPDEKPSLMDVSFKILEKVCQWNKDFSEGMSLYRVLSNDPETSRKAVINIRLKGKKGKIQLLYENDEPRIFNIKE
jgi:hypothetical protein